MEEGRGRELLTTLAGLFVFNSGEDIKINVMDVELGWKIKDGNEKVGLLLLLLLLLNESRMFIHEEMNNLADLV